MIQPNELRLLNWVKYDNRYFKIHSIADVFPTLNTDEFGIGVVDYNNISPVELTPDILEAAGFKYNQLTENYEVFYDCVGMLGINKYDGSFVIANDNEDMGFTGDLKSSCKYLHQLQNLIYCLTGEELQIELTKLNKEK